MNWIISTLKNPRIDEVRYVGWTSQSPERRMKDHIQQALRKNPPSTYKDRWILSLLSIGLRPVMDVIESGTGDAWAEAERRWIADFRAKRFRLTNAADGGQGSPGADLTRKAAALKNMWANRTPDQRGTVARNISAARRLASPKKRRAPFKKRWAELTRVQRRAVMKTNIESEKQIASVLRANANMSAERRALLGRRVSDNRTFEQRSVSATKRWANMTGEQRAAMASKVSATWASKSGEQRAVFASKMLAIRLNTKGGK